MSALASVLGLFVITAAALAWLWAVQGVRPNAWDVAGVALALAGMAVIVLQPAR